MTSSLTSLLPFLSSSLTSSMTASMTSSLTSFLAFCLSSSLTSSWTDDDEVQGHGQGRQILGVVGSRPPDFGQGSREGGAEGSWTSKGEDLAPSLGGRKIFPMNFF